MVAPVLRALVSQHSGVKITVVSRAFFKPFFDSIPGVDFFAFDDKKRHQGFFGLFTLFNDLKRLKIDAYADLHSVLRSIVVGVIFKINGFKVITIDKGRIHKAALTRSKNKVFKQLPTVFDRYATVFKQLELEVDLSNPVFPAKQKLDSDIMKLIGDNNSILIGIAPFAQYESKVYPVDLMQEVIDNLAENVKCKVLLFGGGKDEIKILNSMMNNHENVINIAGNLNFKQELKLFSNLNMMISMDSGNGHIAAMLGVNVVTLWGATHPFCGFAPFNQPFENAITSDRNLYPKLPTSVYGSKKIEGYEKVMRTISVAKIITKVNEYLN